jgi:hypothetical protein
MALDSHRPFDRELQMDLDTALEKLELGKNRSSHTLDCRVLSNTEKVNNNDNNGLFKGSLLQKTMEDKAMLAIIAKNTEPFHRAGKKMKASFLQSGLQRLPTGFDALDKHLSGGISTRGLTQILGPEAGGKTTFIHYFIRTYLESTKGSTILYISPIDDSAILSNRVEANLSSLAH